MYRFFASANIAASAMSVVSLILVLVMEKKGVKNSTHYFFLFVHDLVCTLLFLYIYSVLFYILLFFLFLKKMQNFDGVIDDRLMQVFAYFDRL